MKRVWAWWWDSYAALSTPTRWIINSLLLVTAVSWGQIVGEAIRGLL